MPTKKIKKILLVEDDRSLGRLYYTKLQKIGYTVRHVTDGKMCLDVVSEFKPDIILLDIIIPKIDGFSVLRRLKKDVLTQNIPVILLTNLGQDEDVEKGKKLGARDYLVKAQFTPSEIVERMEGAMNKE